MKILLPRFREEGGGGGFTGKTGVRCSLFDIKAVKKGERNIEIDALKISTFLPEGKPGSATGR